jgi:ATP-binding cassette subfamily F protein 3
MMGLAAFNNPHLLILDEPTNHLDIDSRTALMEAINDYEGAVILVSHDRFLIEACADRLWLVADGTVQNFDGDMDDYRRFVLSGGEKKPGNPRRNPRSRPPGSRIGARPPSAANPPSRRRSSSTFSRRASRGSRR